MLYAKLGTRLCQGPWQVWTLKFNLTNFMVNLPFVFVFAFFVVVVLGRL